ncbi:3-hexulose-6-phosphate synthase [Pseudarthrobacter sp. NamE2]|uniref:3-hexulose-6-phosphate synthase n=1 Tax=Pseudarthrobacter sp. NamE2 TaxID=2576838 RepID=UPI0010FEB584|nr:3-hexulose-6-phosphate synthase [Pseudarthrobacter sp. NamE2]TLM83702.1 3-hexulose-6-phosphate synthase [Pseudarthrobacter sp. NamE2]
MKLQVAMDLLSVEDALKLAGKVAKYVDIIELGTPLIKTEGLSVITAVKEAHPDKLVFADMKTMDAGELEAEIAFEAGADLVTVLGAADDSTIAGAVKAAKLRSKGVVVDLIGVEDKVTRAKEVRALGAKFVEMHAGLDEQAKPGFDLNGLLRAGVEAGVPFSVAGGVKPSTIDAVQQAGADVAVVGAAIYGAADPTQAAKELRSAIMWRPAA